MKKNTTVYMTIISLLILSGTFLVTSSQGSEGSGSVKLGYVLTDEEGGLGVNQETYNTYEGLGLSFNNFSYFLGNGIGFKADLKNVTLNNRNITATAFKPGCFNLTVHHDQYRRTYDSSGNNFTRRRTRSAQASIRPIKYVEVFGGYSRTDKHGRTNDAVPETLDTTLVDFTYTSYNIGVNVFDRYGNVRMEYRRNDYANVAKAGIANSSREADVFRISGSSMVPRYNWITLAGGFNYRKDAPDEGSFELKTNQGWGAVRANLPSNFTGEYRISFARTEQTREDRETDNVLNTISVGKTWSGRFGLRVGYENRISDDLINRTESQGFLTNAWFNYKRRLFLKGMVVLRDQDVKTGATLTGDETITRHKFSATYRDPAWGSFSVQWKGQVRKHDPALAIRDTLSNNEINSRIDYNVLSSKLNLKAADLGRMIISYSYYLGQYENNSAEDNYEFSDHIIRGTIYPREYRGVELSFSGTYYRSRRDNDVEKFRLTFGGSYAFLNDHRIGVEYHVFNYDDFFFPNNFYTGNIVELYVTKDLKL